jgi:hypothetical protein
VTGSNVFDFEPIMHRGDNALDLGIGCDNQMKAASNEVNAGVDRGRSLNDFGREEWLVRNEWNDTASTVAFVSYTAT